MQGNDAIARGMVEAGCAVAASYPGTPASEILASIDRWRKKSGATMHVEWAVNEKVALEIAYTAAITGLRAAVSMKQVGLNVASDPLLSAAYLGVTGGFLVVSADDPGPHSSQTEQDSRLLAMMAKVPVLDPASPSQAMALAGTGFDLSEAFGVPVMLRPTTRVCHASQDVDAPPFRPPVRDLHLDHRRRLLEDEDLLVRIQEVVDEGGVQRVGLDHLVQRDPVRHPQFAEQLPGVRERDARRHHGLRRRNVRVHPDRGGRRPRGDRGDLFGETVVQQPSVDGGRRPPGRILREPGLPLRRPERRRSAFP